MSSSRTLSRKLRTFFTCIRLRFNPSIILLYIAASIEQYCDITRLIALPENEGILEPLPGTLQATAASEPPDNPNKARYEDPDRRANLPAAHHAPAGFGQHRQTGNPRRSRRSVDRGDRGRRGQ